MNTTEIANVFECPNCHHQINKCDILVISSNFHLFSLFDFNNFIMHHSYVKCRLFLIHQLCIMTRKFLYYYYDKYRDLYIRYDNWVSIKNLIYSIKARINKYISFIEGKEINTLCEFIINKIQRDINDYIINIEKNKDVKEMGVICLKNYDISIPTNNDTIKKFEMIFRDLTNLLSSTLW